MTSSNRILFIVTVIICFVTIKTSSAAVTRQGEERLVKRSNNFDFNQIKEIIPTETQRFYEKLTDDDKSVLQNVLSKSAAYNNVSEVLNDLRNGSTTLYDRAVSVVTQLRTAVAKLSPPARKFVDETVDQVRGALGETFSIGKIRAEAGVIVERYRALDEAVKTELKGAFPTVTAVVYNGVFQTLAAGLLGINSE